MRQVDRRLGVRRGNGSLLGAAAPGAQAGGGVRGSFGHRGRSRSDSGRVMEEERQRDARSVEYGELPELTRGLRALGSSRHDARALQSVFFQPLVEARRKAADARDAEAKVKAFDARELERQLERVVDRIVNDWADPRASARRAVRAQLKERVAPYAESLAELEMRAADLRSAEEG